MDTATYSRRLLSPFHGVQQIIAVSGGIAESMDGQEWKLYVAHDDIISHTGLSEVVYGSWNAKRGLSRSRIRGTMPSNIIESIGEQLIDALERHAQEIPFPAADTYELWLLDEVEAKPLVLLDSALSEESLSPTEYPTWHPGGMASQHFSSDSGSVTDVSNTIHSAAGKRPFAIWIKRHKQGNGTGQHGEHFPVEAFPQLLIRDHWQDNRQHKLVADFIDWQAPWLLQLKLTQKLRKQLEQAAWRRPLETSRVYRLFPDILDRQGLTATRVKARLISDKPPQQQVNEPFYPFVNE
ncbi:MAG: hypothetical protein MI756_14610 [Chromatiales bacterium]|nr:hypothetical protein [Chromatiales bacterium]